MTKSRKELGFFFANNLTSLEKPLKIVVKIVKLKKYIIENLLRDLENSKNIRKKNSIAKSHLLKNQLIPTRKTFFVAKRE